MSQSTRKSYLSALPAYFPPVIDDMKFHLVPNYFVYTIKYAHLG